jgi:hypothetical protein
LVNERVSDSSGGSASHSAIAADAAGNAYAVWVDYRSDSRGDIYFAYRLAGGTWGSNVRVNDDNDSETHHQYYPAIAVDGNGNAYAVWYDSRTSLDIYFAYRPAGGTWGGNVRVDVILRTQDLPAIAVDASGNAYAVWVDERDGPTDIYFAYRPADGTWGPNERVNDLSGSVRYSVPPSWSDTIPAIAVDASGNAYAVWVDKRNDIADIYFAYRPADGAWDLNERVNNISGEASLGCPDIAVDASGNAYAVWTDTSVVSSGDIYFAYRPAGGTWEDSVRISDGSDKGARWDTFPSIAVDAAGNAYAVWERYDGGPTDIYFAYRPAGRTWGSYVRVNNDRDAEVPDIVVDAAGNAYVVWENYPYIYFTYLPADWARRGQ